ncbi:MAG: peptidoglycan DD-metalloendopeptidase family protein [Chitinophagaceae bacterium]|nr:peptidoglycan DD-metalloendopeptidase family protein [Chitinophagaceae bacterium]
MSLTANFGELRPNHWHMGLDLRTEAKVNYPVYAAAEGYIAYVGIRPFSFGRFLVINHPNGLSTLYAHMNDFFPALEEYVRNKQYEQENWAVELTLSPEQFRVSHGAFIGYSGKTGGSQGPHLHFEIFETKSGKRINPLVTCYKINDHQPPRLLRLAVYDRTKSTYRQSPILYRLKSTDSGYVPVSGQVIKTSSSKLSFGIEAYDKLHPGASEDGIYAAALYRNDELQVFFRLDSIGYEETKFVNAHIDYKLKHNGGPYIQHLSVLPGNKSSVYKKVNGDGVIELNDTIPQHITVEVKDAAGNISLLRFQIQKDDSLKQMIPSLYQNNNEKYFIPNRKNVFQKPSFEVIADSSCFYDTVAFVYYNYPSASYYALSETHQLGYPYVPLHKYMTIKIKPNRSIPEEWNQKALVERNNRNGSEYLKATPDGEWFSADSDMFGSFRLIADLSPPTLNEIGKGDTVNLSRSRKIIFYPVDNTGIKHFRAELNGKWLRFTNDKGKAWIYEFDENCPFGTHHLKVKVEDLAGNVTEKEWWFRREPYVPKPKRLKRTLQNKTPDSKSKTNPKARLSGGKSKKS